MNNKGIDVLVHNIGHHDAYVLLGDRDSSTYGLVRGYYLSSFTDQLLSGSSPLKMTHGSKGSHIDKFEEPFELDWSLKKILDRIDFRSLDKKNIPNKLPIHALHFPILIPVIETWLDKTDSTRSKVVLLVSSQITDISMRGTSTYGVAQLLSLSLSYRFPNIEVKLVKPVADDPFVVKNFHLFVRTNLLPEIQQEREHVVNRFGDKWEDHFGVTLSASTGTTPMISSILAALRPFRPNSIHVPRARQWARPDSLFETHWLSFGEYNQAPAFPIHDLDSESVRIAAEAMIDWRDEYLTYWDSDQKGGSPSELRSFWLRKSAKSVLAILVVEGSSGELQTYRATNLEVSLPTGTLCAERNAIGSALAHNPSLRRDEIKAIAVLSIEESLNPLSPCGACMEWLRKIAEANPDFKILTFTDLTCSKCYTQEVSY